MQKPALFSRLIQGFIAAAVLLAVATVVWLGLRQTGGPRFTLINDSASTLTSIELTGTGFLQRIDTLVPGGRRTFSVKPCGESGLRIAFDAAGKHHNACLDAYIENSASYRATVTVAADLSAAAEVELRSFP